jgi:hypothetical protein
MQRLKYFRPFCESEQPDSSTALPQHSEPLHYDTTGGSVYCEFYGEEFPCPYTLRIIPERELYQLVFPSKKFIWGTVGALDVHKEMLSSFENGALYDWMCRMIDETYLYYSQLSKANESTEDDQITSYSVEVRSGEFYWLILDKERNIAVTHYPARMVVSTPEEFYLQNDGLIGIGDGKVENTFLDRLRENKFDMKAVLSSRRKAMEKIDYLRQKDI